MAAIEFGDGEVVKYIIPDESASEVAAEETTRAMKTITDDEVLQIPRAAEDTIRAMRTITIVLAGKTGSESLL